MAALNFPSSPTIGDRYTANGKTWEWDGVSWNIVPAKIDSNVDGGSANSVYLPIQSIDGGNA
jgi:hypothetical protein